MSFFIDEASEMRKQTHLPSFFHDRPGTYLKPFRRKREEVNGI